MIKSHYTILLVFLLFAESLYAQRFSTLDEAKLYFNSQASRLDRIEGVWNATLEMQTGYVMGMPQDITIIIIKEDGDYHQYLYELGNYTKTIGVIRFVKSGNTYTYKEHDRRCNIRVSAQGIQIRDNSFTFEIDYTDIFNCYAKRNMTDTARKFYTYQKLMP